MFDLDIHQPAAFADQFDFSFVGAFEITRFAVHRVPDHRPENAHRTGGDEHHVPAEFMLQPGQYRRQEREADKLPGGVETDGRGAFTFREPGGDYAAVDRIGRGFEGTDGHAQDEQRNEAAGEPEHHRGDRPQQQCSGVEDARRNAVHQPAAGDLHGGIGPAECGENQPDVDRVDAQVAGQRRGGDRQVAAVQIVDHHRDEQQHHDEKTLAAGRRQRRLPGKGLRLHGECLFLCLLRSM
ncbi:hypothetical protein D3C86_1472600 [compost metagenome]